MNPLFPANKQPEPGKFSDGTVVIASVKFDDNTWGRFSFKDIKAGDPYTLQAVDTMFERMVSIRQMSIGEPIKPYEWTISHSSEVDLDTGSVARGKKKFDPADLSSTDIGARVHFPKEGEIEKEPELLDPKTLSTAEKE